MKKISLILISSLVLVVAGCATVNVTKTAKGYFKPTNPADVEILVTVPTKPFVEIATVTTQKWETNQTAKMHNSLRAKCAPLGADAIVLGSSGIDSDGKFWTSGVAIKYKDVE